MPIVGGLDIHRIIWSPQASVHDVHDVAESFPIIVLDAITFCCPSRKQEVRCAYSGCSCRVRRRSRGLCSATTSSLQPVERFLGYLASIERSPNTVKAYAHDLKDWFTYLAGPRP